MCAADRRGTLCVSSKAKMNTGSGDVQSPSFYQAQEPPDARTVQGTLRAFSRGHGAEILWPFVLRVPPQLYHDRLHRRRFAPGKQWLRTARVGMGPDLRMDTAERRS